jgi:S-adenosylmethionine-diacylglycerol 3-amino-3-carboxypropyl transferase
MNTPATNETTPHTQSKKVGLDELIFTMSWEDGDLDRAVFAPLGKGARLATVASGGCNALTFLLDDPAEVVAFDYNPTQVYVVELKRAAFLALEHAEILELFGVRPSQRRAALLARVEAHLSSGATAYFKQLPWLVTGGLLGGGRYERFVSWFRVMLRAVQGARTVDDLFAERSATDRQRFYDERWDGSVWRLLFRAFFNKRVLASRGLSADYFHFAGGESFADAFSRRTKRVLTELSPRDNPFVAQYVLGRYLDEDHLPEYLRPGSFDVLRERMPRLTVQTADVRHLSSLFPAGRFDGLCLSNVFELMSEDETKQTLARIEDVVADDGRMTLRNLMVPRAVAPETRALVLDAEGGAALHNRDRSFVYRSFQSYRRSPRAQSKQAS